MPKQTRAQIPENTFGGKPSAVERLASSSPQSPVRIAQPVPVGPQPEKEKLEKMSIYVTAEQKVKLDELAKAHRKQTGESTSRIDVVRMLIEQASIDMLPS